MSANKDDSYKFLLATFLSLVVLCLSAFNLNSINGINSKNKVLGAKITTVVDSIEINREMDFWKGFLLKNPTYFEGWVELSNLSLLLDQKDQAQEYLNRALKIEPNREIK